MLKNSRSIFLILVIASWCCITETAAQTLNKEAITAAAASLKLRPIGPALMGGRIADIKVSPADPSTWYVAAGSGGVWKTTNRGTSWTPVFDEQSSYSIGTIAIDPNNTEVVWIGTGENVSGRHMGWGDGIYKSLDGGKTWKNMGLPKSEHIGRILVDPRNSNVVLVAAEGPLWSAGGERGLYKTKDGGKTWQQVLAIDENTGVTDVEFDPSSPDVLYAAAYQRRRHTWSLLAGGPKSGIYKSTDNGDTWRKVTTGLPSGDMGKIGLAVTPADPALVYATIEASDNEKGFYKSTDKGESWTKQNSYISGGTGPHYYQEIEVSPQNPDLVYQMDVFLHVTRNGGKSFDILGTGREKHSDNHALWIDPADGEHLIVGCDAGLYESYDEGITWRHFPNLPISQFYKVSLDNALPFYNVIGGAQDLGSLIGPSRTLNSEGVRNQDWYVPLGADGYDNAVDPDDPNIVYIEIQQGSLNRLDRRSEELLDIQPQPAPGDAPERWNWDAPILISPHKSSRLYYGSQRLWRSEDRGNSWTPISGDLTTNRNRYELELMGKVWSVDALYDNGAMSKYATLTNIAESPLVEGVLYTGSDDGLIQITEDGGKTWRKSAALPKVPALSFINDIEASAHDANMVFVSADAHKFGDFKPYLFLSPDRGRTWKSIVGDLPATTIVWSIKQDYVEPNLLFAGTEYGIYFSPNLGTNWVKLGGTPIIPFRDVELHKRDTDLVGASFGRGFYVLDDYSSLRTLSAALTAGKNTLFSVRDAWWYVPNDPMQARGMPTLGTTSFRTANPPFGAVFTYYLNDLPQTMKAERQAIEKSLATQNANVPFPGWERLQQEATEDTPLVLLLVSDAQGNPVRWIKGATKKGLHRTNWELHLPAPDPIDLSVPAFVPPWASDPQGPLAAPGKYSVTLYIYNKGALLAQGAAQEFTVKPVPNAAQGTDFAAVAAFQLQTSELSKQISAVSEKMGEAGQALRYMKAALLETPKATPELYGQLNDLQKKLTELQTRLNGDRIRGGMNEASVPSIRSRVGQVASGHWGSRQTPTATQQKNIEIATGEFATFRSDLAKYLNELTQFEAALSAAGAPYTPGREF